MGHPSNFLIVLLFFGPITRHLVERLYDAFSRYGLLAWLPTLWVVGSTLLATALFVHEVVKKLRAVPLSELEWKTITLDGVFLCAV